MKVFLTLAIAVLASCGGGASARPDAATADPGTVDAAAPDAAAPDAAVADAPSAELCAWEAPPGCTATDLAGKLACIPGLTAVERPDLPLDGYVRYDLTFAQPIDHAHPELGTFTQRAMLMFAATDKPMVLATSGYNLSSTSRIDELASMFGANELWYEHRFFLQSTPSPDDWSKLDIEQAAADAHRLAAAMHWLFPAKWVNTGASKGGMTSVYHRRFYPCDVDATVAYVAPVSLAAGDPAYNTFLTDVGGTDYATCRSDLRAFQRQLLQRRAEIIPLVTGTFTRLPVAQVYELAVIELAFSMWQYTRPDDPMHGCAAIPPPTATPAEMLAFLDYHSDPAVLASDDSLAFYRAYYHQAQGQLGFPAPFETGLDDLLQYPGTDVAVTFLPPGTAPTYDPSKMPEIRDWVATTTEHLMFVYGQYDPWSTRMYQPGPSSVRYVEPAGNHGAKIRTLAPADRTAATATLESWLDATVLPPLLQLGRADDTAVERRPL
jgi:PS-10 peptidase S37